MRQAVAAGIFTNRFTKDLCGITEHPSRPGVSEGKCGVTIEEMMDSRRSLEEALADLLATYERGPNPALARTIELMRAEIEIREQRGSPFLQNEGAK